MSRRLASVVRCPLLLRSTALHPSELASTRLYRTAASPSSAAPSPGSRSRPPPSLAARHTPWPTPPGMSWSAVLEAYARKPHPERDLPEGVWLCNDERTLTIFDGYEKAKFHFLVMPRDPFPLEKGGTVPSSSLHSLSSLLKSPHKLEVLKALERQAAEVKEMIEDEMMKREGWTWDVRIGFHANESMRHVHLHVISSDMLSPKLKNKKHWNSFHPELGFFLHLSDVIAGVEDGSFSLQPKDDYESILKLPLQSFYDGRTYANLPKLKDHLLDEFKKRGKAEKARIEAAKENEDANENEKGTKREADTQEGATQLQNDGESPLKKPKVDA